jgi:hypothetical protein
MIKEKRLNAREKLLSDREKDVETREKEMVHRESEVKQRERAVREGEARIIAECTLVEERKKLKVGVYSSVSAVVTDMWSGYMKVCVYTLVT